MSEIIQGFIGCDCENGITYEGPQAEITCEKCGAIYQRVEYRVHKIKEGYIPPAEEGDPDGTDI